MLKHVIVKTMTWRGVCRNLLTSVHHSYPVLVSSAGGRHQRVRNAVSALFGTPASMSATRFAGLAQLVERDLAKVEATGSYPVSRSIFSLWPYLVRLQLRRRGRRPTLLARGVRIDSRIGPA